MLSLGWVSAAGIFGAAFTLNLLVLAYRWKRHPGVRRTFDRLQRRLTGRDDWGWLKLWHILLVLAIVTAANVAYAVPRVHCADDSLGALAAGQVALHGGNPFAVNYCANPTPDQEPYGLAHVSVNVVGALGGNVLGIWVAWQLLALAVVPLVWFFMDAERRYYSVLAASSVLYLPNIATNIGVENAIVPVAILVGLAATRLEGLRRPAARAVAAFLSTARFPAAFGVLGSLAPERRHRFRSVVLIGAVFGGSVALSYALWGPDAIRVVYLGQFARLPGESANLFSVFLREGWVAPSLVTAAVQGGILLGLVGWVNYRGYSPAAGAAIPMIGVMATSQYFTFHFVLWILPIVLLGPAVNSLALAYGTLTYFLENVTLWYWGQTLGIWWPYEITGVVVFLVLVAMLYFAVREEELRRRRLRAEVDLRPAPL